MGMKSKKSKKRELSRKTAQGAPPGHMRKRQASTWLHKSFTYALGTAMRSFLSLREGLRRIAGLRRRSSRLLPGATLTARGSVDKIFCVSVVWRGRWWGVDDVFEDRVIVGRERVASGVDVDRGGEGLNVQGLLYAPFDPIRLAVQDGDVRFSKMVTIVACML